VRCGIPSGRGGIAAVAAAMAVSPARVVAARCVALAGALVLVAATALPLVIVAQQIAARPLSDAIYALVPAAALAAFAAVASTASSLWFTRRLAAWIFATVLVVTAGALGPSGAAGIVTLCALAAAGGALTAWSADGAARYLSGGLETGLAAADHSSVMGSGVILGGQSPWLDGHDA
jgi:hypothetical protein